MAGLERPEPTDPDAALIRALEDGVPLVARPWQAMADSLGWETDALLARLRALRGPGGLIREISAIFDARALGYRQSLVAFEVDEAHVDSCGAAVAAHPGVSHCYRRDGRFNLWFTLAVSPQSRLGLEKTVDALKRQGRARARLLLPSQKCYKLSVRWSQASGPASSPAVDVTPRTAPSFSREQIRAIRALQRDLPAETEPFASIARAEGLPPDALLGCAADFLARGWMRRYGAVLYHRRAGARANVMVAWEVDDARADAAGTEAARMPQVSHCFLRPFAAAWPYRLYTMIHGKDTDDCRAAIDHIAAATGLENRAELWTRAEYKKRRARLFTDEEARWERSHGA